MFLFLQGPQSFFFDRLARVLIARGHLVHRINLNLGDRLFWRLPATNFRGRPDHWPEFVATLIEQRAVTDLVLLGAQRPYHLAARAAARRRGTRVWSLDLGYLRPGWLTLANDDSVNGFPRDADAIRALARRFPEPNLTAEPPVPFWRLAAHDIAYHFMAVLGRPLYPHHRRHGLHHPFAEYAAWVRNTPRRLVMRGATASAKTRLAARPGGYFLFPLQLATDFQLRAHSPFPDARDALRAVVDSFLASGSTRRLVIVGHPLDEGLIDWRQLMPQDERVIFLEGGVTEALIASAAGVVTVNSTVGLAALRLGVPVKTLGTAIYDIAGLTHPGPLAAFWHERTPPDPGLLADFLRVLVGTTQIKGDYYTRRGQVQVVPAVIDRLEQVVSDPLAHRDEGRSPCFRRAGD